MKAKHFYILLEKLNEYLLQSDFYLYKKHTEFDAAGNITGTYFLPLSDDDMAKIVRDTMNKIKLTCYKKDPPQKG